MSYPGLQPETVVPAPELSRRDFPVDGTETEPPRGGRKIVPLDELVAKVRTAQMAGLKVAQCHGVFDLLHPGHIRHLSEAAGVGDMLIVTITPDHLVNKGPGRPVFNQRLRAETLAALESVAYVAVTDEAAAVDTIRKIRPDYYVKGKEYAEEKNDLTGMIGAERDAVEEGGGAVCFTEGIVFSSTKLLNDYFGVLTPEAQVYLNELKRHFSAEEVVAALEALKDLKVLVVGDTIIDEYCYVRPVGKSSKSATITARYESMERHAGGALAVANHAANFAGRVDLLGFLGDEGREEAFVRSKLAKGINPCFIPEKGRPTIVKRRYVEPQFLNKMYEVMWLDGDQPTPAAERRMIERLGDTVADYDLVIVADFGHGNVGDKTIRWLADSPAYLAVNAQTNSANYGFNPITKYPRADYFSIDEQEMRLANHSRSGDLDKMTRATADKLGCRIASVTTGKKGSLTYHENTGMINNPVLSTEVVDPVGAGDAFLTLTALGARAGWSPRMLGFVGNCVGALAVRIVGNRESVERVPLYKFVNTLLK